MGTLKKWTGLCIFLLGMFVFFKMFKIQEISNLPMGSFHCWRQADCISMTNEFYAGKATFYHPTTHYVKKDGTRFASGEFPIINKTVASIYKITGPSLKVYRYTIYFFYLIGFIFLFFIFFELSKQPIGSALLSLLIASSSILVFYSINFLPDVPALSLGIISLYAWILARKKKNLGLYALSILILLVACLIKLTMLILLGTFALVILVEMIIHARRPYSFPVLGFILMGLLMIVGWYYHSYQLDHTHAPFIFLTETRSYWKTYFLEKPVIWNDIRFKWLPQVFITPVWYFVLGAGIMAAAFGKKVRIEHKLMTASGLVAAIFFFFMMFRQFMHHDYLWIDLLIVLILFAAITIESIGNSVRKYPKCLFAGFIFVLICLQTNETKKILNERYFSLDNNIFYNQNLIGFKQELRNHGIEKTDLVLSIPDASPNITLTVMDQYGFTLYREDKKTEEAVFEKIDLGARYLIVSNPAEFSEAYLQPFVTETFFHYKDIWVYNLQDKKNLLNRTSSSYLY